MISISFPDMLTNSRTKTVSDKDATASNLKLLLQSDKNSLLGDPYFGTNLKHVIFAQNNAILQDLIIDDIYTNIIVFMPQLVVRRKDITLESKGKNIYATIKALNKLDYTTNLYEINLTDTEEF